MTGFSFNSCIGLTWSPDGECHGVRVARTRAGLTVVASWRASCEGGAPPAATLVQALPALGADENTGLVTGGTERIFASVDLVLPHLSSDDLRSALHFELRKHSPVAENQLAWGYRIVSAERADGTMLVRLSYARDSDWQRWIAACSGLTRRVDALLPPAAAVDPVFEGRPVLLAGSGDEPAWLLSTRPKGEREWLLDASASDGAFGAPPEPLAAPDLDPGELRAQPVEAQQRFVPALLLALYGMGDAARADQRTWLPIPLELRPRRHRLSRRLAVFFLAYVLILGAVLSTRAAFSASGYLARLRSESKRLEQRLAEAEKGDDPSAFVDTLGKEIAAIDRTRPTMTAALVELTEQLKPDYWVANFTWNDAKIELEVHSETDDLSFIGDLEASPIFSEAVALRKTVDPQNRLTIHVQMLAVAPSAGDAAGGNGKAAETPKDGVAPTPDATVPPAPTGAAVAAPVPPAAETPAPAPATEPATAVEVPPPPPPPPPAPVTAPPETEAAP